MDKIRLDKMKRRRLRIRLGQVKIRGLVIRRTKCGIKNAML